jgi:enterochelin esterase-like enzyme
MRSLLVGFVTLLTLSDAANSATDAASAGAAIESPFLRTLAKELDGGNRQAEATFWKSMQGKAPLVEVVPDDDTESLVTYLWRGSAVTQKVDLIGGVPTSNRAKASWEHLPGSDVWFNSQRTPKTARFGYALRENGRDFQTDPLNPRTCAGRSILELAAAPTERWIASRPEVSRGILERRSIRSAILGEERGFGLFRPSLPKGVASKRAGILLVFDGESYGNKVDSPVPTPTILDNLIAEKKTPPLVAVLLDSQKTRERDLLCSQPFNDFLAKELLPWVRKYSQASDDPALTVVAGSSYGGLAAGCAALFHPEVFGKVLSQSATLTYYPGWTQHATDYAVQTGWLTRQFAATPRRPVRFFVSVGLYEGGPIYNLVRENRHLRDVLEAKGYAVEYAELVGAHDYLSWRNSLGDGLAALFK